MATTAAVLEYIVTANTAQANAALAKTQGQLVTMGKTSKASGAAVKAGFAAVAVGAGAAAVAAFKVGDEFDKAYDKIQAQTGATGKEFGKLQNSFRGVLKAVPTDFDSAATAVAGLNQRLGETGKPLTQLARQITALSELTGTDVQENVESITRLFGDWSVATKDQVDTLDGLFRVSQKTGATVSDLARNMVQFGAPLRNLGFGIDQAAAMFGAFEKTGVNITTVLSGLRLSVGNFAKPTDDLARTMEKLNLSAKDTPAAIIEMFRQIKNLKSESEATALAIDAFGKRAGPDLVDTIRGGKFELDALIRTFNSGDGTIRKSERAARDFDEQWQLFTNRIKMTIEPVATDFFKAVGRGMKMIRNLNLNPLLDSLKEFWQRAGFLRDTLREVWGAIKQNFQGLVQFIRGAVKLVSGLLTGDFRRAWSGVKDIFQAGVKGTIAILRGFTAPFRVVLKAVADLLANVFRGAWDNVKDIFRNARDALIGIVNWIISNVINRIPGVELGSVGGGGGGGGGDRGAAPGYARGGKVNKPMAIVGEEAPRHPEFVLATNPAYRQRNLGLWEQAGKAMGVPGFAQGGVRREDAGGFLGQAVKSAGSYISKLDDAPFGDLPDFMEGTGEFIRDKFADFIRDKVANLAESAADAVTSGMTTQVGGPYAGVTGDTDFVPALGKALSEMARSTGQLISVTSGRRTMAEQAALYAAFQAGVGNLAAPPNANAPHVRGIAADISPGRETFGGAASRYGLGFTVPSESWHIELLGEGGVVGRPLPKALQKYNRTYPRDSSEQMPFDHIAMLAEFMGKGKVPGIAAAQVTKGESNYAPGAIGNDPGGTTGYGLWQITTSFHDALAASLGGYAALLNPVRNAIALREVYQGDWGPWYGDQFVTNPTAHWQGEFGELTRAGERGGGEDGGGGNGASAAAEAATAAAAADEAAAREVPTEIPKTIDGVRNAIQRARKGLKDAKGPKEKAAWKKRLTALRAQLIKLIAARHRKRFGKQIAKFAGMGKWPERLAEASTAVDVAADEVAGISTMGDFVKDPVKTMGTALGKELGAEMAYRWGLIKASVISSRRENELEDRIEAEETKKKPKKWKIRAWKAGIESLVNFKDSVIGTGVEDMQGLVPNITPYQPPYDAVNNPPYGTLRGAILATQTAMRELKAEEAEPPDNSESLAILRQMLTEANQRYAVSQAQYGVFAGMPVLGAFAKGGAVGRGGMYLVGEHGPEVVGLQQGAQVYSNQQSQPMLDSTATVIINGDIVNTPPGMAPVEVPDAKAVVRQGSRGYGKRVLPGARGR